MPVSDLFPLLPGLHHGGLGDRGTGVITLGIAECPSELGKEIEYGDSGRMFFITAYTGGDLAVPLCAHIIPWAKSRSL